MTWSRARSNQFGCNQWDRDWIAKANSCDERWLNMKSVASKRMYRKRSVTKKQPTENYYRRLGLKQDGCKSGMVRFHDINGVKNSSGLSNTCCGQRLWNLEIGKFPKQNSSNRRMKTGKKGKAEPGNLRGKIRKQDLKYVRVRRWQRTCGDTYKK